MDTTPKEVMPIVTQVNDEKRLVTVWLTNDEKNNTVLREELKPLFSEYKAKKYTVAVFQSGTEDLYDNTLALLKHNKIRSAEVEVQQAKQAATG